MEQEVEHLHNLQLINQNFKKSKKVILEIIKVNADEEETIKQYLDIIIDDRIGLLDNKKFCIDLEVLTQFLELSNKANKKMRANYIQNQYENLEQNVDYIVRKEGKSYFILITPLCFRKHIIQNQNPFSSTIKKYFIQIEKIYRQLVMTKVKKSDIKGAKELIFTQLEEEHCDNELTRLIVDLSLQMKDEEFLIDLETIFNCSGSESFYEFKKNFKRRTTTDQYIIKYQEIFDVQNRRIQKEMIFLSLDSLKNYILSYDKNVEAMNQVKLYFFMAENFVFQTIMQCQTLNYETERKITGCYFYIIKKTNQVLKIAQKSTRLLDIFKFGITNDVEKRLSNYNVGKLYRSRMEYFIKVDNCKKLEKEFSQMMELYKVYDNKGTELIKINEKFMIGKLKMLLVKYDSKL